MKRVMLIMSLLIGMISYSQAQNVKVTNGDRGFVSKTNFAEVDSAETYSVQVLLNTSTRPKVYAKVTVDSTAGDGTFVMYQWYKLYENDTKTYIDTTTYAGTGADTTIKKTNASANVWRYWGFDVIGTDGSVKVTDMQVKTFEE